MPMYSTEWDLREGDVQRDVDDTGKPEQTSKSDDKPPDREGRKTVKVQQQMSGQETVLSQFDRVKAPAAEEEYQILILRGKSENMVRGPEAM